MSGYQKVQQNAKRQESKKQPQKVEVHQDEPAVKSLQKLESPDAMRPGDVLAAQKQAGNQVVQRALDNKLAREASTDSQGNLLPELSDEIQKMRGSGNALPGDLKKEVSSSFKKDFGNVRIHTDEKADKLSKQINARAFTIGSDIFFKKGVFDPSSSKGRDTIFHELTHVVQQSKSKSGSGRLKLGAAGNAHEQEAENTARKLANSKSKVSAVGGGATVQKQEEEEIQTQAAPEEEEIQTQGAPEEEEIQTQGAPEEEEIQTQGAPEEEEIQTQADGGVVQRNIFDKLKKKAPTPDEEEYQRKKTTQKNSLMNVLRFGEKDTDSFKDAEQQLRTHHKSGFLKRNPASIALKERSGMDKLRTKIESNQEKSKLKGLNRRAAIGDEGALSELKQQEADKNKPKDQAPAPLSKKQEHRQSLLKTIEDPNSKHEDVQKAEAELRKYHSRKFRSNYSSDSIDKRRGALEAKAKEGDPDAQKKLDELNTSNPTKTSKVKNFFTNTVGGFLKNTALPGIKDKLGGFLGGQVSGKVNDAKALLGFGGGSKDKDEGDAKGGNGGGGGSDGGVAGMIAQLYQENMSLKKQIEALKKGN